MRAYVTEVCGPELADEAASAAFVDFLARTLERPVSGPEIDRVLLAATRSAAAGRFTVVAPAGKQDLAIAAECRAMPELLALHADGERAGDEQLVVDHLARCAVCAHTLDRVQRAEQAFARASGDLPELEIEGTIVDTSKARVPVPRTSPPVERPNPQLEPEIPRPARPAGFAASPDPAAAPSPPMHRRRSGGLVGAIRRRGRPPR